MSKSTSPDFFSLSSAIFSAFLPSSTAGTRSSQMRSIAHLRRRWSKSSRRAKCSWSLNIHLHCLREKKNHIFYKTDVCWHTRLWSRLDQWINIIFTKHTVVAKKERRRPHPKPLLFQTPDLLCCLKGPKNNFNVIKIPHKPHEATSTPQVRSLKRNEIGRKQSVLTFIKKCQQLLTTVWHSLS